jgi:hypothetical protein
MHRVLLVGLLTAGLVGARVAMANASAFDLSGASALVPSDMPDLLEPITYTGRTGWECTAERAAASSEWRGAGLPDRR